MMTPKLLMDLVTRVTVAVGVAAALVACGPDPVPSGTDPLASASSLVSVPPPIGQAGCSPGSPSTQTELGLEIQGTTEEGAELWALFEVQGAIPVGKRIDVWWRVPGDRVLELTLVGPGGEMTRVTRPRPAVLEGWDRPGEPWFSQIAFPEAGCWRIVSQRSGHTGELWIGVG